MGDTTLTFLVPNNQRPLFWYKQLWLQMTYYGRSDAEKNYDIEIATEPNFVDANIPELAYLNLEALDEPSGDVGSWYRLTAAYVLPQQPAEEYVRLTVWRHPVDVNHFMGGPSMVDQVDIDTRAINPNFIDVIDFKDYAALAAQYKESSGDFDLCPDGMIDLKDLSIFFDSWLKQGPTP
jgi:hypothetical protein